MSITQTLAEFIFTPSEQLAAPDLRTRATRYIVDTMAVTLAGAAEPALQTLGQAIHPSNDAHCVTVPWSAQRYREEDACLLLGMAAHILDYDDVSMLAVCHPSAPVLAALLALAPNTPTTGADFIDAYIIGTEVMIRCGQAMGFRHYDLGFHATATLGSLGASAACARLLKLSHTQTCHALSIAASSSSGVRKNFGSMVKSLHAGQAASSGLRSARLAQAGIQGASEALEDGGWLKAFSGGITDYWPASLALGQPFAISDPGFEQKRYPCCYLMHKIIQATLVLQRQHGLSLEGFERAQIDMCKGGSIALIHPQPRNGLNAKFSAPYAVVGALADGRVDLASFQDDAVLRPAIQSAMGGVCVIEDDVAPDHGSDLGSAAVTVNLFYRDARSYAHTITASPGSPADPLTSTDLQNKWRDCLARGLPSLPTDITDTLFNTGLQLDTLPNTSTWLAEFHDGN
ncbi:MmgE/PrpD family protein [Alcaligenaceae bacterium]|nr:MmgE/PrpD family protein [Alcaligenaceae bacterium]